MKKNITVKGMLELKGIRVKASTIPNYNFYAHLIDFDGPLLSLFKGEDNVDALFMWVDNNNSNNRWCIIPVERSDLDDYLSGVITLKDVVLRNDKLFYFNYRETIREEGRVLVRSSCILVDSNDIPEPYLPKNNSYLYDEICTPEAISLKYEVCSDYDLGIDKELYFDDIAIISKKFIELYSFHYALDHLHIPAIRDKVVDLTNKWDGGISVVNMFSGMNGLIPSIHKPRVQSLAYNSPGNIKLNLIAGLAEEINVSIAASMSDIRSNRMSQLYDSTYKYFKAHDISGFDNDSGIKDVSLEDEVKVNLDKRTRIFIKLLKLDAYERVMKWIGGNELQRLRTILAYYRRFRVLSKYQKEGKLLIGTSLLRDGAQ
ncbi:hypothetical protein [Klebsiella michiganensis]|uniref:hypothetical protein n=1 Tax=Klebsiella michiganensis TaxID=1134687 RepID=UPI000A6ACA85|nr:hypothetical protein [Klebsiella michiganensis]